MLLASHRKLTGDEGMMNGSCIAGLWACDGLGPVAHCGMLAMLLDTPGRPLRPAETPTPEPGPGQVLLRVQACGVCRTDLHLRDGELEPGHLPLVLGHQIVATVDDSGERVGVPWLAWACGECQYCRSGRENLCRRARFTGRDVDGGYAEYAVADERYCFPSDLEVAPLLCGGLIGHRALRLAGDGERLGLYGFGASAHIVCQVAVHQGRRVFAFTRPTDTAAQSLARELGAEWAGDSMAPGPEPLDAAIIFAPAGALVPAALRATAPGGIVVCAGIHMSDLPSFPYAYLWEERVLRSVANLTREDAREFLELAPQVPVRTTVQVFGLERAEEALAGLRAGHVEGAAVLRVRPR
jgi:propanol-preferring alcohol dehydrogenase